VISEQDSREERDGKSKILEDVLSDLSRAVYVEHTADGQIQTDHDVASEGSPKAVDKASASINVVTMSVNHLVQGLDAHKAANGDENETFDEIVDPPAPLVRKMGCTAGVRGFLRQPIVDDT
jgi:hypothetical protein